MAELTPLRDKFGHHDLISLKEDYPLSYRDTCCGLPGLVPPYCALLKYIGFIDLDLIVFQKLFIFLNGAELAPVSPSVFILHLPKPLFSVFHMFQALSIFVLVNDLYIGDPLEANLTQEICIFQ